MEEKLDQLEALHDIRRMMQDSSKFLSLSGLSGVIAGIYALIGAFAVHQQIFQFQSGNGLSVERYDEVVARIFWICVAVAGLSIATGLFFSYRKALKQNRKLLDRTSRKLLESVLVPMACGGLFCLALLEKNQVQFIIPAMLLFYGVALVNSSKFTLNDIKSLGYLQLVLGIIAAFFPGWGLILWSMGFGILHILYGTIMWFKYDR